MKWSTFILLCLIFLLSSYILLLKLSQKQAYEIGGTIEMLNSEINFYAKILQINA